MPPRNMKKQFHFKIAYILKIVEFLEVLAPKTRFQAHRIDKLTIECKTLGFFFRVAKGLGQSVQVWGARICFMPVFARAS